MGRREDGGRDRGRERMNGESVGLRSRMESDSKSFTNYNGSIFFCNSFRSSLSKYHYLILALLACSSMQLQTGATGKQQNNSKFTIFFLSNFMS